MLQLKFNFQIIAIAFACCFPSFLWAQLTTINNPSLQDKVFLEKNDLNIKKNAAPSMGNKQFQTANVGSRSAAITINGGGVYCSGQTATLSVNGLSSGATIYWNTGDSTASISVSTSGKYWATTSNPSANTDTVAVIFADYSYSDSITASDLDMAGRLTRNGVSSSCGKEKSCPGVFSTAIRDHDIYSFSNTTSSSICVKAFVATSCRNLNNMIFITVYLYSFNPTDLCTNYLADMGISSSLINDFSFEVPAFTNYYIVIHNVNIGEFCSDYNLYVDVPRETAAISLQGTCNGSATLTASAGQSYLWNTGATTQSISTTASGNYTVTISYGNNSCIEVVSYVATITDITLEVTGGGEYCGGQSATLSANGTSSGATYLWNTGQTSASINATSSGVYWVSVTEPSLCVVTDTVTVIIADYQYNNVIWPTDNSGSGVFANGVVSNCSTTKAFPGSSFITNYDVYSFYNAHDTTVCVTAAAKTLCGNSQSYSVYNPIMVAAYLNYYPSNYLADIGNSPLPFGTFGFSVPAKTSFDVIVYNVYPGSYCGGYSLYVDIPRVKDIIKTTGFLCKNNLVATAQPTASTYLWSNGATTQSINIASAGTYYCSVTYSSNCMEIDSVIVNDNFNPSVSDDVTINCINTNATLTASGGFNYLWSNGETTASITVSPSSSRTYTVTITNIPGCSEAKSVYVDVKNTPPLANITTDRVVVTCTNPSATLTATGGVKYEWNNGETTNAITVSPTTGSINYTVTVTGVSGCTATANQIILVNKDIPTGMMPPNQTLSCGDTITTVSVTSVFPTNSSFLWNTGETTTTISVRYDSIAYVRYCTVTITGTNGCSLAQSSTVVFFDFNPNTIEDVTINCNSVATLSAQDYIYHFYLWNTGETTSSITVSPSSSQTYTVTITNSSGCSQIRSAKVHVNKVTPLANINTNRVVVTCTNPSATLTATGGVKYEWSNGETTNAITVSPSAGSVNYTVTVTGVSGCTATANQLIIVNKDVPTITMPANVFLGCGETMGTAMSSSTTPNVSFLWNTGATTAAITFYADTIPYCKAYSATVTNTNGCTASASFYVCFDDFNPKNIDDVTIDCKNTTATLTAQNGSYFQYLWNTGETTSSITVSPSSSQTYTVTITYIFGCSQIRSAKVYVKNTPPLANITTDRVVVTCNNPSATLTASGGIKYEWSNGATTNAITVSPSAGSVNYTVTVTGVSGCTATANQIIIVNKNVPLANAGPDVTIGCGTTSATLTASGGVSYLWNDGQTTASITVSPTTMKTYGVTVTGTNGCFTADYVNVFFNSNPPIANAGPDVTIGCGTTSATLTAAGGIGYLWSDGQTTASITVSPTMTKNYSVTVTAGNNCSAIDDVNVFVHNAPPIVSITTNRVVVTCTNPSATLTATGGVKYEWNNGETTNAITVSPSAGSVNYTVTVTNSGNCTATANQIIIVNKNVPLANAGPDVTIGCGTTSATLTASGGVSYLWNDGQTTASITVSPTTMKTYGVTVTGTNGCFTADYVNVFYVPCSSRMNAKVFFQQMDINSLLMDSYLSSLANFPLNDPYNIAPLNAIFEHKNNQNPPPIPASVMARTGANAIVDWVFIELRQGNNNGTTVAFTKAALLQRNGELVNSDGTKPLVFPNVPSGQYYAAIRHRNHLGFRTAQTHFLSNVPIELNFTNNSVNLFGSSPFTLLNNNIRAMRAGDANSDGSIDAFDSIQWESENGLFDDYLKNSDYNLDGSIDAFDAVIWEFNNGTFEELD